MLQDISDNHLARHGGNPRKRVEGSAFRGKSVARFSTLNPKNLAINNLTPPPRECFVKNLTMFEVGGTKPPAEEHGSARHSTHLGRGHTPTAEKPPRRISLGIPPCSLFNGTMPI